MTNEEAIEILQEERDWAQQLAYVNSALEIAIEALEKQIPKKPIFDDGNNPKCPNCGCDDCDEGIMYDYIKGLEHCSYCGQAIDWSDA